MVKTVKAEDIKQTWRDVAGLNALDTLQWIEENIKELPFLLAWLLETAGYKPLENTINVRELPACELCGKVASFRGDTHDNQWKNMCEGCFQIQGVGLGLSTGYKLELVKL